MRSIEEAAKELTEGIYLDASGSRYWLRASSAMGQASWYPRSEAQVKRDLEYQRMVAKDDLQFYLSSIESKASITGVAPKHFHDGETFTEDGDFYLNNSKLEPLKPEEDPVEPVEWGKGFPFVARLLEGLLDGVARGQEFSQRDWVMAWLRHAYRSTLTGKGMVKGQALYLAGTTNCGKTFLSTVVFPKLFGGILVFLTGLRAATCSVAMS